MITHGTACSAKRLHYALDDRIIDKVFESQPVWILELELVVIREQSKKNEWARGVRPTLRVVDNLHPLVSCPPQKKSMRELRAAYLHERREKIPVSKV